jgi:hypothetical protein
MNIYTYLQKNIQGMDTHYISSQQYFNNIQEFISVTDRFVVNTS